VSISIYYEVKRKNEVSEQERVEIQAVIDKYSVNKDIVSYLQTGEGLNWESFDYIFNSEPSGLFKKGTMFSGFTKLPDNSEDATWIGVQHWCKCLTEIRKILSCTSDHSATSI